MRKNYYSMKVLLARLAYDQLVWLK